MAGSGEGHEAGRPVRRLLQPRDDGGLNQTGSWVSGDLGSYMKIVVKAKMMTDWTWWVRKSEEPRIMLRL